MSNRRPFLDSFGIPLSIVIKLRFVCIFLFSSLAIATTRYGTNFFMSLFCVSMLCSVFPVQVFISSVRFNDISPLGDPPRTHNYTQRLIEVDEDKKVRHPLRAQFFFILFAGKRRNRQISKSGKTDNKANSGVGLLQVRRTVSIIYNTHHRMSRMHCYGSL